MIDSFFVSIEVTQEISQSKLLHQKFNQVSFKDSFGEQLAQSSSLAFQDSAVPLGGYFVPESEVLAIHNAPIVATSEQGVLPGDMLRALSDSEPGHIKSFTKMFWKKTPQRENTQITKVFLCEPTSRINFNKLYHMPSSPGPKRIVTHV